MTRIEDVEVIMPGDKATVHVTIPSGNPQGSKYSEIWIEKQDGEPLESWEVIEIAKEIASKFDARVVVDVREDEELEW